MSKRILTIIALAAALGAAAQGATWLQTVHDFGAFSEDDGKVSATFRFVNSGDKPVAITSVRANCGCTTPDYSRHAVEPCDTGLVTLTYNPVGRPGRFTKKAYVTMSGYDGRYTLEIKGVVIGAANTLRSRFPVDAPPLKLRSTVVPFGTVAKQGAKTAYLDTYNASTQPVVPRFEDVPRYIRIVGSSDTVPPGEQTTFGIILTPSDTPLYGVVADSLTLVPAPGAEPLKIEVVAIIEEDFTHLTPGQLAKAPAAKVEAEKIDFGSFSSKSSPLIRKVKLSNTGKSDLLIRRTYSLDPGVSITADATKLGKGKSTTLTIAVDPSRLPSEILDAHAILITNDPGTPTITLRLVGLNNFSNE